MSQRFYKFTCAKYGISSLRDRRLKKTTIDELNDPFDHYAIDTTDSDMSFAVTAMVAEHKRDIGIICLSRNWNNLLMWSHYADKHKGVCLGFDIPDGSYLDVRYQPNLLQRHELTDNPEDFANRMLSAKHESWSYEQEVRVFVDLNDPPDEDGRWWIEFNPELQLREVIIGVQCSDKDANEVCEVLKGYPDQIKCTLAYMRSDAFLLARDKTAHSFRPSERQAMLNRINEHRKEK
jgi:Protein of unknown function (DUF2971)